jgi:hypothetical protein
MEMQGLHFQRYDSDWGLQILWVKRSLCQVQSIRHVLGVEKICMVHSIGEIIICSSTSWMWHSPLDKGDIFDKVVVRAVLWGLTYLHMLTSMSVMFLSKWTAHCSDRRKYHCQIWFDWNEVMWHFFVTGKFVEWNSSLLSALHKIM